MTVDLKRLRYDRTRTSNSVRATMRWMLTEPARSSLANGLPSWWPFWSDVLKDNVREAVRAARRLEAAEGHAENERLHADSERLLERLSNRGNA